MCLTLRNFTCYVSQIIYVCGCIGCTDTSTPSEVIGVFKGYTGNRQSGCGERWGLVSIGDKSKDRRI